MLRIEPMSESLDVSVARTLSNRRSKLASLHLLQSLCKELRTIRLCERSPIVESSWFGNKSILPSVSIFRFSALVCSGLV
jgi:hypothetical protein